MTTTESPPPFQEPPQPVPPAQLIRIDSKKLRVSYNNRTKKHLDSLSDDLVLKIFQFLPKNNLCRIARVCRRFYFLVWEAELWTHISLNVKNCDQVLTSLIRHLNHDKTSENVLKICLKNSTEFSNKGLELIGQSCPNLKHFEVKNCKNVTNFGVQNLVQKCKSLSHLDLAGKIIIICCNTFIGFKRNQQQGNLSYKMYLFNYILTHREWTLHAMLTFSEKPTVFI